MDAQSPMALILVGQSELWDRLRLQSFAAIRQRIDIQFRLERITIVLRLVTMWQSIFNIQERTIKFFQMVH
jgi:type II secretory pathway predicted ATPase ExeA